MADKKNLYKEDLDNQIKQSEEDVKKMKENIEQTTLVLRQTEGMLYYAKALAATYNFEQKPEEDNGTETGKD